MRLAIGFLISISIVFICYVLAGMLRKWLALKKKTVIPKKDIELKAITTEEQSRLLRDINHELQKTNNELVLYKDNVKTKSEALEYQRSLLHKVNDELLEANRSLVVQKEEMMMQYQVLVEQRELLSSQNEKLAQSQQEISTQRDMLEQQNVQLQRAQQIIEEQNIAIADRNKTLEIEVDLRTRELVEYSQQLEQFAFYSAHNLRGPVARILGLGQLLKMDHSDEVEKDFIFNALINTTRELDTVVKGLSRVVEAKKTNDTIDHLI